MSQLLYLGRPLYQPLPHTRIEPLALAEDGGWRTYSDWTQALPNEGRVFAPRLPGFAANELFAFHVEPNPRGPQDKDQLVVVEPRKLFEVLDFRQFPLEIVRRRLVEHGIPRILPGSATVVAALGHDTCVIVKMVRHPVSDRWVANIEELERLETHGFDERLFEGERIDDRWIAVPGHSIGVALDVVNWCRDADFLDTVLKRLRKINGAGALTRAQITQVVMQLDRGELMPAGGADLDPMATRLRDFAPALNNNLKKVDEIVTALADLDSVRERLEAEIGARRASLEAEIREEVEARVLCELEESLADLNAERDRLAQEAALLQSAADEAKAEVEAKRVALEGARSAFTEELGLMLSELNEAPPDATEALDTAVARLVSRLGERGGAFEVAASRGPPWATPRFIAAELKSWNEFEQTLATMALRWGYAIDDLRFADAAARAGRLVLLPEESGARFVACYADALAGGGFARNSLDPSVISVDDLWRQPGSVQVTAFARVWAAARLMPTRYHIVLLDGLHRTPTALWLPSFFEVLDDVRRPSNLLVFATMGEGFVDPERVWCGRETSLTALNPQVSQGTSPRVLARASGVRQPQACLDPLQAPIPAATEIVNFLSSIESGVSPMSLEVAAAAYRAAWVFGADGASSMARRLARLEEAPALVAGAKWLAGQLKRRH